MEISLTRKCVEKNADLGLMYDARQEKVIPVSIFRTAKLPEGLYVSTDTKNTDYYLSYDDSYEQKFKLLDVSAELKIDVLSGKVKLSGSGAYFSDEKKLATTLKGTISAKIRTVRESVNMNNKELNKFIEFDSLSNSIATHVIVGIQYGGDAFTSFEYTNKDLKDQTTVKGNFEAAIDIIKLSISGQARVDYDAKDDNVLKSTKINFIGDCVEKELPQTVQETIDLFRRFPTYLQNQNNGKGVPILIELLSINEIMRLSQKNIECDRVLKKINLDIIRGVEVEFDNLLKRRQELNDLIDDCDRYDRCLNNKHKEYLLKLKNKMSICESKFKEDLAGLLYDVRAGLKEPDEIEKRLDEFKKTGYSSEGISLIFTKNKIRTIQRRIQFLTYAKDANISIFEKTNTDISMFAMSNCAKDKHLYVLKTSDFLKGKDESLADKYWKCFLTQRRTNKNECLFYIYDYELSDENKHIRKTDLNNANLNHDEYTEYEEIENSDKLVIEWYYNGRLIKPDCYEIQKDIIRRRVNTNYKLVSDCVPEKNLSVRIPCANFRSCPRNPVTWMCKDCDKNVVFGENLKFYCDCGSSEYSNYEFQCTSTSHPEGEFCKFEDLNDLKKFLLNKFYEQYPKPREDLMQPFWRYEDNNLIYVNFLPNNNKLIEEAYSVGRKKVEIYNRDIVSRVVDFEKMTHTNLQTKKVRNIRRFIDSSRNSNKIGVGKEECILL